MKNRSFFKSSGFYLGVALAIGSILRIYHLGYESLWADEAFSVFIAKKSFIELITLCVKIDVHPPLYVALLKCWIFLFGISELALRSFSAIFGILTIYIIYRLGSLLYDRMVGVIASYVSACSAFLIRYSQEARSYALLAFLSTLSIYLFCKFLKKADRKNYFYLLIVNVLLSYTHIFGLMVIVAEFIFFFVLFKKTKRNFKQYLSLTISNVLMFIPWLLALLSQASRVKKTGFWIPYVDFHSMLMNIMRFYSGGWNLFAFGVCVPLLFIGIPKFKKALNGGNAGKYAWMPWKGIKLESFDQGILLFVWLLVPLILCSMLSILVLPVYGARNLIVGAPAFYILLSAGIRNISGLKLKPTVAILVFILSFVLFFGEDAIGNLNQYNKENWRDLTQFIMEKEKPADVILVYPYFADIPFEYYYKGKSKRIIVDTKQELQNQNWDLGAANKLDKVKRIWVVYRLLNPSQEPYMRSLYDYLTRKLGYAMVYERYYTKDRQVWLFLYERNPKT